jgi:hypothetical protein
MILSYGCPKKPGPASAAMSKAASMMATSTRAIMLDRVGGTGKRARTCVTPWEAVRA